MTTVAGKSKVEYDLEAPPYAKMQQNDDASKEDAKNDIESLQGSAPSDIAQSTGLHGNLRNAFLRRVYGLLTAQIAVTVSVCSFCALYAPANNLVAGSMGFWYGSIIPALVCLFALAFVKNMYPWNLVLLGAFTLLESLALGVLSATYYSMGMADALISAGGLTLAIFVSLTAFVLVSKKDFSFLGGFLFTMLFVMIGWGLLNIIFGWKIQFVYSALGALLFCGFILFDTSLILEKFSYDEYIPATINLYLDIINLFLYLLQLFSRRN